MGGCRVSTHGCVSGKHFGTNKLRNQLSHLVRPTFPTFKAHFSARMGGISELIRMAEITSGSRFEHNNQWELELGYI